MSQSVAATKTHKITKKGPSRQVRLWVRAKFTGFRRSKVNQNMHQPLLRLEGVNDTEAASNYFGKRVVYVYKLRNKQGDNGTPFKAIWGRINKSHGNNGAVTARFAHNLPARAMGATLRVMLYPQRG